MKYLQKVRLQWLILPGVARRMRKLDGDICRVVGVAFARGCIGFSHYGETMYTSNEPVVRSERKVDIAIRLRRYFCRLDSRVGYSENTEQKSMKRRQLV